MVPAQFIVKQYTEFLSRAPSFQELSAIHGSFPCTPSALSEYSRSVMNSAEYRSHGLTLRDTVRAMYRGLLNREPDQGGWDWHSQTSEDTAFRAIVGSQEYRALVARICNGTGTGYGWGVSSFNSTIGFHEIKQRIETALPGAIIELPSGASIAVTEPIRIPPGVTVRGQGSHYLKWPTFYRSGTFDEAMFTLANGSALSAVYIDGRKTSHPQNVPGAVNVTIKGSNAAVYGIRADNVAGWASVLCAPFPVNRGVYIAGNLIIGYGNARIRGQWADGISLACDQATAIGNTIVDATDVGIILFSDWVTNSNSSRVMFNRVLQAGNDTWGMIGLDQSPGADKSFASASFEANELFTAPRTKTRVGILDGTRTWYGPSSNFKSPWYSNYGGLNVELFGTVGDNGFVYQSNLRINMVPFTAKPGCTPMPYASALVHPVDRCLL